MTDILILALNSKYIHSSLAPWYLKSAVSDVTNNCTVLEHTVNEKFESVISSVSDYSPKILAISVYIWNLEYSLSLAKAVKELFPYTKIVLGGPEVSYNPYDVLHSHDYVDFVISGEGEVPFRSLSDHILNSVQLDSIGVSYRKGEEIFVSEPFVGTETPKSPYSPEYFEALKGRIAYFESSRGCPYSCAYCLSGRCEGIRFFEIEYVKENLIALARSGSKTIKFVDRTFNADKSRAKEIWSFIIEESGNTFDSDVCFHFELSGDLLDESSIALLNSAPRGLFQFEIGIQSFCEKTIDAIHRVTDSEKLKSRIRALVEMGNAHIHTDLIAGLPYEGYDSFKKSFNEAYLLGANMLQLGFLKILHGTELERKASEYGLEYSAVSPYEVHRTPWISKEELALLKTVDKSLDRLHNSGRFKRTLELCIPFFPSPFDFFLEVGTAIGSARGLDEFTDLLYNYLCGRIMASSDEIRDALICDRLATNSSRLFPKSLFREDAFLHTAKSYVSNLSNKTGVRRNVAILYHSKKVVFAEYDHKNHRGEYPLGFIKLEDIENEKA